MRVMLLSSAFSPSIGGAESYALMLSTGLSDAGHDVHVVTDMPRKGEFPSVQRLSPLLTVHRTSRYLELIDRPDKVRWEQLAFALHGEILQAVPPGGIDIVHANNFETALLGSSLALTLGVPLVCTFHEHWPEREPLGAGCCQTVHGLPIDAMIGGSEFYYERASRLASQGALVELISHGIDTDVFTPGRSDFAVRRYGLRSDTPLVVCSGRLSPRKGQLELVQSFAEVARRVPEARLLLAGSCNSGSEGYRQKVMEMVGALGLREYVIWDGELQLADMPSVYQSATVVTQPSYGEGLGLALLEAMACEVAVVGTRVSGITEVVVEEESGVLVPLGDTSALGEALVHLLLDSEARRRLGAAGRVRVLECFSKHRMIAKTVALYQSIRARRSSSS